MTPWKSNELEEELCLTKSIPEENKIVIQQQPLVDCIVKEKHKTLTERMVSPPPVKVMKTINSSNNQKRVETTTMDGNKQLDKVNVRNQKPNQRHDNNISSTVINKNTLVRNITKQYNKKFKQTILKKTPKSTNGRMKTFKTKFQKQNLPKEPKKKSVLVTEAIQPPKEKIIPSFYCEREHLM